MFGRKDCKKCGKKINDKYEFCPHCGYSIKGNAQKEDWGMLGRDDTVNEFEQFTNSLFGGVGGKMFGKMFEGAMKMIEKEMQKGINPSQNQQPRTSMELFINGQRIPLNQSSQNIQQKQVKKKTRKIPRIELPKEKLKGFYKLPQTEPSTDVRRLSDRVIYEIKIPGVSSKRQLSIAPLEEGIEIKAITKNKAYFKILPIKLPIINYNFSRGKLVLELGTRG